MKKYVRGKKAKEPVKGEKDITMHHTLNTISIRFSEGEENDFSHKRYAFQILTI